jgi:regulator of protease activity HflC (stomatin/prohibitin superfamily)
MEESNRNKSAEKPDQDLYSLMMQEISERAKKASGLSSKKKADYVRQNSGGWGPFMTFLLVISLISFGPLLVTLIEQAKLNIMETFFWIIVILAIIIVIGGLRIVNEYQRGVILTFGKYKGTRNPGLRWIFWPFGIQQMIKVDLRVKAVDVPDQKAITKDNISVNVNAVVYYKVKDASKAVLEVEDFFHAISQLAQTTMRDAVGEVELDQLLAERDNVSEKIRGIVDKVSDPWGIDVSSVSLKDVALPPDMERTIAKQAEAEREKRAVIIKAEGEVASAENMRKAADILNATTGALHLRTLQSLNDLSSDQSNTVIFAVPLEILRAFERFNGQNGSGGATEATAKKV